MTRFAYPYLIFLIFLIIPCLYFSKTTGSRIRFSSLSILKSLGAQSRIHPRLILTLMRAIALALFIFALARPQSGKTFTEINSEGVDILLAIDTSGSMQALDFKRKDEPVNRLTIVQEVVGKFIDQRAGDRMGLVVFGEEAFTQCPLTLDHGILLDFLEKTEIGMAGESTAIGSAIGVGCNRMNDIKAKSKIIILLTDGRNTAGKISPIKAAELAQSFGIKIYTIGVGTNGKAPFLVDSIFGKRYVYQEVDLDEDTLKLIASTTGGEYFRATDTARLKEIYEVIDNLEKTEVKIKEYTEYNEVFHWFLIPGLLLLLLEILLGQTRLRKIP